MKEKILISFTVIIAMIAICVVVFVPKSNDEKNAIVETNNIINESDMLSENITNNNLLESYFNFPSCCDLGNNLGTSSCCDLGTYLSESSCCNQQSYSEGVSCCDWEYGTN